MPSVAIVVRIKPVFKLPCGRQGHEIKRIGLDDLEFPVAFSGAGLDEGCDPFGVEQFLRVPLPGDHRDVGNVTRAFHGQALPR